jgi:plastocyanin
MATSKRWTLARGFLVVGLLLPVVLLTILVHGFVWLSFGPVPFLLIPMALIGIVAIWWPNPWLLLVGAVIGVLNMAGSSQGDPGFLRPDRTLEFTFWWLIALLGVGLLVAAIANLVQRRAPPARPGRLGVALVAVVVALYFGGLAVALQEKAFVPPAAGAAVGEKPDLELNLTATDDKWTPAAISVPAGKVLLLHVTNGGSADHVFDQPDAGIRIDLAPGSTHDVWLKLDAAGALQYYCELHAAKGADGKWAGMVGALSVT